MPTILRVLGARRANACAPRSLGCSAHLACRDHFNSLRTCIFSNLLLSAFWYIFLLIRGEKVYMLWVCYLLTYLRIHSQSPLMVFLIKVLLCLTQVLLCPRRSIFSRLFHGDWKTSLGCRLNWCYSLPVYCGMIVVWSSLSAMDGNKSLGFKRWSTRSFVGSSF